MIYIYFTYLNEESHNEILHSYLKLFTEKYQKKILKYKRWQDSQLSLLGRLLLIYGMDKLNKKFDDSYLNYTQFCKPFISNTDMKFNISHSGKIAVCAISDNSEVGIDVELIKKIKIETYKYQMTENEYLKINFAKDSIHAFYEYWTKKEAIIKASGFGLSQEQIEFDLKGEIAKIGNFQYISQQVFLDKCYKCHVAFKKDKLQIENYYKEDIHIEKVNFKTYSFETD